MKKTLLTLLFFIFATTQAQIVNIPNANFKAKLLAASPNNQIASTEIPIYNPTNYLWEVTSYHKIDTNNDGEIQVSEAVLIKFLVVDNSNISNLTGIEAFTNLINLKCASNQLTTLNISGLTNLKFLYCNNNQLQTLNVTALSNLQELYCHYNQLNSLNVSGLINLKNLVFSHNYISSLNTNGLTSLQSLGCNNNNISTLNLSDLSSLKYLYCHYNQLTTLDVSGLSNLIDLFCGNNQLSTLNVNGLSNLIDLRCNNNLLTTLNVTALSNLQELYCYNNQLTSLDVTWLSNLIDLRCNENLLTNLFIKNNNITWQALSFSSNPNLSYICADEEDMTYVQSIINGSIYTIAPNCHVNSYCTFTPGGTFYTLQGNNKIDTSNNGCDTSDSIFPNVKYAITNGTISGTLISNSTGNYSIPVSAGTHTITPQFENANYFTITPANAVVTFPATASPFTQNFCVTPNGVHHDVEVTFAPVGPARPGFDANYQIIYKNKGNQVENGNITLNFDDNLIDFVSATPAINSQVTNVLTWNYTNLQPFETRSIQVKFNVNSPMETPAVNIGDILNYTAVITPLDTDEVAFDNTSALKQVVVGSYDPNDKTCVQGATIHPDQIGKYVHYVVRFENTGTFAAENVVVKDMIDATKFDVSSLQVIKMSHQGITKITGNKVEFIFQGINLPFDDATNDGYVIFKIKTLSSLVVGNTISNKAEIYFDYNFPIITNLVTSVFQVLSNPNFTKDETISIYPNPAQNFISINSKNNIKTVELYDLQGRVIISQIVNQISTTLDISDKASGVYFVKTTTDKGVNLEKVVFE